MVGKCDGAYASKDKILCDFVGERLYRDKENVGSADPSQIRNYAKDSKGVSSLLLRLNTPEADLSIVQSDFIYIRSRPGLYGMSTDSLTGGDLVGFNDSGNSLTGRVFCGECAIRGGRSCAGRRGKIGHGVARDVPKVENAGGIRCL